MIKPPYTKWINDIKTKLGFNRTMTASGADVVDAVNKQAQQIDEVGSNIKRTGNTNTGAQINSGSYFWVDNSLCRAKSNIASGETFTDSNRTIIISGGLNDIVSLLGMKADYPNSLPFIIEGEFNANETIEQTFERCLGITINNNTRGLMAMGIAYTSVAQDMTSGMDYTIVLLICAGYYQACFCIKGDTIYFGRKPYTTDKFSSWKTIKLS